ncbi:MAG: sugar phosphate nucleotidyltransferase [Phycisphaerales bacterium]|nr:sugar phosphate nucleotidyltransferase [Phycisphaerales bacterium]
MIRKAMLFCAGLGTRLGAVSKTIPKALVSIHQKTLLQRNIEYLQLYGIKEVLINVHHFPDKIIEVVNKHDGWGSKITISDERDSLLETGGGLKKACNYFNDEADFVLMNVDILTTLSLENMFHTHQAHQDALVTLAVTNRKSSRYFWMTNEENIIGWGNDQTGEQIINSHNQLKINKVAFSGVHIIRHQFLELLQKEPNKISITDVYKKLFGQVIIKGFDHSQTIVVDVGTPDKIRIAEQLFA